MVGTKAMNIRIKNENETEKLGGNIKKFGVANTEATTKRAALGDIQNRVVRAATGKDAVQKDMKDTKLQTALRNVKARVDTQLKKAAVSATSTETGTAAATTTTTANTAKSTLANAVAAGERKILTRSNSVRLVGTNGTTRNAGIGLQRQASNNLLLGQQYKTKTVTTKLVENKLQQAKTVNKTSNSKVLGENKAPVTAEAVKTATTLRREDSNLSRKSLTRLKAALGREASSVVTKALTKTTASSAVTTKVQEAAKAVKAKPLVSSAVNLKKTEVKVSGPSTLTLINVESHSTKLIDGVEDIDAGDSENLVLVSEYVNDIYDYLYSLEEEQPIRPNHLEGQEEVTPKMRTVLIDWINEVASQFHLAVETFQMAVAIIDRYLQEIKDTKRAHLQLVGVTALFIATKYEELFPPAISDFVYITDNAYTARQIRQMELQILKALDYNLSRPLPIHFLRRFSKAIYAEDTHHAMSKYFCELSLVEYELAPYKPSEIAAASLFLALHLLNDNAKLPTGFKSKHWTPTLEFYSRYRAEHLKPISRKIALVARNAQNAKLKAVYTKYETPKFFNVSKRSELYGALMDSIIGSTY